MRERYAVWLCDDLLRAALPAEEECYIPRMPRITTNILPFPDVRARFPRLLADVVDHIDRPSRSHGHLFRVDRLDEIRCRFYGLVLDSRRPGSPRSW